MQKPMQTGKDLIIFMPWNCLTATAWGRFDGSTYTADGVRYRMYQQNGQYLFDITENGQATEQFPVAYTFGWEPLQQYLVARPGGRYQTLRISWDTEKQQWFHQYPDTVITPGDWLHWTGAAQTWNSMCAACHSTHLEKNYIAEKIAFTLPGPLSM